MLAGNTKLNRRENSLSRKFATNFSTSSPVYFYNSSTSIECHSLKMSWLATKYDINFFLGEGYEHVYSPSGRKKERQTIYFIACLLKSVLWQCIGPTVWQCAISLCGLNSSHGIDCYRQIISARRSHSPESAVDSLNCAVVWLNQFKQKTYETSISLLRYLAHGGHIRSTNQTLIKKFYLTLTPT